MKKVIIRDDDIHALTPIECLKTLYTPFLEANLPVNFAVIPNVDTEAQLPDGKREGFLFPVNEEKGCISIAQGGELLGFLKKHPQIHLLHHGCRHTYMEFETPNREQVDALLEEGSRCFREAGLNAPTTFVAPYDRFSRQSMGVIAQHFSIISSGWYEARRLPLAWWPHYLRKKWSKEPHWKVGGTRLLTHPGCYLSYHKPRHQILPLIEKAIAQQEVTVLVTHWWEYFRDGKPDEKLIQVLHEVGAYLRDRSDLEVVSFADL